MSPSDITARMLWSRRFLTIHLISSNSIGIEPPSASAVMFCVSGNNMRLNASLVESDACAGSDSYATWMVLDTEDEVRACPGESKTTVPDGDDQRAVAVTSSTVPSDIANRATNDCVSPGM